MGTATIHFSSGKTREIGSEEFSKLPIKLNARGIKTMLDRTEGRTLMIPLNSNTIEFIEEIIEIPEVTEEPVVEVDEVDELTAIKAELAKATEEVESKKDKEEIEKEKMDDMMAKSSCTHPEDGMVIYRHDTKKGSRYFPVCSFCGKRERYVKAESLPEEAKATAKIWED